MEQWLCGVDLGGTKLAVVFTDKRGHVRDKIVVYDHVTRNEHEIVLYMTELIRKMLSRNHISDTDLQGIGVCFPGHIRSRAGITITTSNLQGFKNFPLKQAIQEHFQTRVIVDNDANAQTYAEFMYGAGKEYESMIFMTISSGIGGGIVIDNLLYRGITGTAGEFGHMIIDAHSTIQCGCGNYGCLMGCASGLALPKVVQKHLDKGINTTFAIGDVSDVNGKMLKMGLDRHDELCEKVLTEYAEYIGIGVYNIFQIFNPPLIVLGGGLMKLGDWFFQKIKDTFFTLVRDMLFDEIRIVLSTLEEDAGVIGAAALLLENHE